MTLVLVNPHAQGGRVRQRLPALAQALEPLIPIPRLHAPETPAQAQDLLMTESVGSPVVLVGGDGSFNRWLPALLARQLRVGLLPLGSGNDLARALGLNRRDWRQALAQAVHGRSQAIDTGLAIWRDEQGELHRTPFASSLTCGFDAAVGLRALHGPRWLRGQPRYLWATLSECRQLRHWHAQGQADGQPLPAGPMLFTSVLNTPTYGSGLPAVPHARVNDGHLHWLRAGPFDRWGTLRMLPTLMNGAHLNHTGVDTGAFRALEMQGQDLLPLAADGEWLGLARELRVTVAPASLQVVAPALHC